MQPIFALLLLHLAACTLAHALSAQPAPLAITHVNVVRLDGAAVLPDQTVLVQGGRITRMGPAGRLKVPRGARLLDSRGKYLIPGLWDMHVHIRGRISPTRIDLPLFVANGVTGVREMASDCFGRMDESAGCIADLRAWQRQIERGELLGPRLLLLGSWGVNGPGVPDSLPAFFSARTAEEGHLLARYFHRRGADFIKVLSRVPREGYLGLAEEAARLGIPLAGHDPGALSASEVVAAGQRTVEHARVFLTNCFAGADEYRRSAPGATPSADWSRRMVDGYDPSLCAPLFRAFTTNRTAYVPTHLTRRVDAHASDPALRNDARLKFVPRAWRDEWSRDADRTVMAGPLAADARARFDFSRKGLEITGAAYAAGVQVLVGTDSGDSYVFPGFSVHDEMAELVKAGLTPAQALRAATSDPARFLGRTNDFGSVEPGKVADLVLLDADPLRDIANTRRIAAVVFGGKVLDRAALDAMLLRAEQAAREEP